MSDIDKLVDYLMATHPVAVAEDQRPALLRAYRDIVLVTKDLRGLDGDDFDVDHIRAWLDDERSGAGLLRGSDVDRLGGATGFARVLFDKLANYHPPRVMAALLVLSWGCDTADADGPPRQGATAGCSFEDCTVGIGGAVPVVIESRLDGSPCVTWDFPIPGDPASGQMIAAPDAACCPAGYGVAGLTHGFTGEDALVCLVLP